MVTYQFYIVLSNISAISTRDTFRITLCPSGVLDNVLGGIYLLKVVNDGTLLPIHATCLDPIGDQSGDPGVVVIVGLSDYHPKTNFLYDLAKEIIDLREKYNPVLFFRYSAFRTIFLGRP